MDPSSSKEYCENCTCDLKNETVNSSKHKIYLGFGSQTGTCLSIAKTLYQQGFELGYNIQMSCLNKILKEFKEQKTIMNNSVLVIITSTFGFGNAPSNAKEFEAFLLSSHPNDVDLKQSLRGVPFILLGLGNSLYPKYCGFSRMIARELCSLGCECIYEYEEIDSKLLEYKNEISIWSSMLWKIIEEWEECKTEKKCVLYDIEDYNGDSRQDCIYCLSLLMINHEGQDGYINSRISSARYLTSKQSSHKVLHLELDISGCPDAQYKPGDCISIKCTNNMQVVKALLNRLNILPSDSATYNRFESILLHKYDLNRYPNQQLLSFLSTKCTSESEQKELELLSHDLDYYQERIVSCNVSLLDVLTLFQSCDISNPNELLIHLHLLVPRYYSIGSCPIFHDGHIHISCTVVEDGLCTNWLNDMVVDHIQRRGNRNELSFKIEESKEFTFVNPMEVDRVLMIGFGTGIMPFRGYLYNTLSKARSNEYVASETDLWLFTGNRHPEHDGLYHEDIQLFLDTGILTRHCPSYSRSKQSRWKYIQDCLYDHEEFIRESLSMNSRIYICGNINMINNILGCIQDISSSSDEYMHSLMNQGIIITDIW